MIAGTLPLVRSIQTDLPPISTRALRRRWSGTERGIRSDAVAVSPLALDENLNLVVGQCPLLALSRHRRRLGKCPLSGVKRTSPTEPQMSAYDPKRTRQRRYSLDEPQRHATTTCQPVNVVPGVRDRAGSGLPKRYSQSCSMQPQAPSRSSLLRTGLSIRLSN